MNEGIFNLTAENYHADPAPTASLSSSIANILLDQSPLHAWLAHPRLNPNYVREPETKFDLGSAAHMMLLEQREDKVVRVAAKDWRTNAAKEARAAAQANGQFAVLEHQYGDIVKMCAVAKNYLLTTELGDILDTGMAEQAVLWIDDNDLWHRARPDLISQDHRIVLDYKSTTSAAPDFIAKQIGRMGYDLQAEFYLRGMHSLGHPATFVFLFQENTEPYACSLISLTNTFREVGKLKVMRAMKIWENCVLANDWPAYTNKILYVEPKPWDAAELDAIKDQPLEESEHGL